MSLLKIDRMILVAFTIFGVQFTNALEYMMISPLFPFMAPGFGQSVSQAGYVASSYTFACVISGILGFFLIDRLNKKKVLWRSLFMIALLTVVIPLVNHFVILLLVRFITGLFGGIIVGVGMALLLDTIPQQSRGKMIALVLSAFPIVSIVGLPSTLWLAEVYHWSLAFYLLSGLCCLSATGVLLLIPNVEKDGDYPLTLAPKLAINPQIVMGAALPGISNIATFMLVPLLVPIFGVLLKMPAIEIPWLFLVGGVGALLGTKLAGWLSNRYRAVYLIGLSTGVLMLSVVYLLLLMPQKWFAYSFSFLIMFATYWRFTTVTIVCANIPKAKARGGFNTLQTAFNHLSASMAFMMPAIWLQDREFSAQVLVPVLYCAVVLVLGLIPCIWALKAVRE